MPWYVRVLVCACLLAPAWAGGAQTAPAPGEEQPRGEQAYKLALERVKTGSPAERAAAADEMGRRGYRLRKEISVVLRPLLLADPEPLVRAAAGRALGRLGVRDAVPELIAALKDASAEVRVVAAAALWRLPDPSAVEPLLACLRDPDPPVREWAALALGVIGDARAVPEMVRLLGDTERPVRLAAVRSLGRIGSPDGLKPLVDYLSSGKRDDEEREEVVNSVASLRGPEKVQALVALLPASGGDEVHKVRVIVALGQVGDLTVMPRLKRSLVDGEPAAVRQAAEEAIRAIQARANLRSAAEAPSRPK